MECPICKQMFTETPTQCAACGFPIEKIAKILQERQHIRPKTQAKAIDFLPTIRAGGWFEVKPIGYKHYLYGRFRDGAKKKSQYLGRV